MAEEFVFSWAENAEGKMVHVDDVPRGLECGCTCPHCHEQLLARHGKVNTHGFAHHSETRGANLKICYMVIMYKLAEQIIQTKKRIHTPSYYSIYGDQDIEFVDVKIDSRYERYDKQPDVIATTQDGKQYLIEFVFKYKAYHKKAIDYKNLTCLEIDLSNQTLEKLESFLLASSEDRKWLNNEVFFSGIEETFHKVGKNVKVIPESDCSKCEIDSKCCVFKAYTIPLVIENSGKRYRLCIRDEYEKEIEAKKNRLIEERKRQAELARREEEKREIQEQLRQAELARREEQKQLQEERYRQLEQQSPEEKTCFNCQNCLNWVNKTDQWAYCGIASILRLPQKMMNPDYAKQCRGFRWKI